MSDRREGGRVPKPVMVVPPPACKPPLASEGGPLGNSADVATKK
jgi:hypothetical protein